MDPTDTWAMHAALHVFEMTSRLNEGSRLLRETRVGGWVGTAMVVGAAAGAHNEMKRHALSSPHAPRPSQEHWEKAALLDHHILWHWCLLSLESGDYNAALVR